MSSAVIKVVSHSVKVLVSLQESSKQELRKSAQLASVIVRIAWIFMIFILMLFLYPLRPANFDGRWWITHFFGFNVDYFNKTMEMNYLVLFGAALIPMIVGFIYYNEKLFGNAWINSSGKTKEELQTGNMAIILLLCYILSFLMALGLSGLAIHQQGVMQLFAMHPDYLTTGTEVGDLYANVMSKFGESHRTFGHGALHGAIDAVLIMLPIVSINALFERRGAKYIGIHFLYWLTTWVLMAGVICQFM